MNHPYPELNTHPTSLGLWRSLVGVALLPLGLQSQPEAPSREVVELPPLIVTGSSREDPHWYYVEMPGFQILSSCSRVVTHDFAESHFFLWHMVRTIMPEDLTLQTTVPETIILVDEFRSRVAREVATELLNEERMRMIQQDLGHTTRAALAKAAGKSPPKPKFFDVEERVQFLPNLRLWDGESTAIFTILRELEFDRNRLTLANDYLHFLLGEARPPLPRWFVLGMTRLWEDGFANKNGITFSSMVWVSQDLSEQLRAKADGDRSAPNDPLKAANADLLDFDEFFSGPSNFSAERLEHFHRIQPLQAALLIRWALSDPGRREKLWKLVARTAVGSITEADFIECMGMGYGLMTNSLRIYLGKAAVWNPLRVSPSFPRPVARVEVRRATDDEADRVLGDWLRRTISYVDARSPQYTEGYTEQARRTLTRAYRRGARDPQLLAILGLLESDLGNDETARPYLEAAAEANVRRPRVYTELARIRLAAARADLPEPDRAKLNAAKTAELLRLLSTAREQAPPLPEVYRLMAQVWSHSGMPLTRDQLGALREGVRFFPGHAELIYDVAELHASHGFTAEAAALARLGRRVATDPELAQKLDSLAANITGTPEKK